MADKNKVTIDADYFAELWKIANEADKVCEDCVREKCGECAVVKERDELKSTISRMEKSVEQMREKDLREIEDVRKERDELKAKLEEGRLTVDNVMTRDYDVMKTRLAAAERCIEEIANKCDNNGLAFCEIMSIIRSYREKKEAAR